MPAESPPRRSSRLTALILTILGLTAATSVPLAWWNSWPLLDERWGFQAVSALLLALLGGLISSKQPSNALGWLLLAMGLREAMGAFGLQYGIAGTGPGAGWLPVPDAVAAVMFGPAAGGVFGLLITFFLLLFPDGRLISRRWRPVAWAAAAGVLLMVVGLSWHVWQLGVPGLVDEVGRGVGLQPAGLAKVASDVGHLLVFAVFPIAVVSLFVRRRRGDVVVRQQLKWFSYGATLLLVAVLIPWPEPLWTIFEITATALMPVAITVAILRYRLYEIDQIVRRTGSYALITAVLVGVYALIAVLPSAIFSLDSDLLVAAATLAAAAAFRPVRRHIQRVVDRRFNRSRYDAGLVVDRFSAWLRQQLDLRDLADDLGTAVAHTVQPTRVWLWLRPPSGDGRTP